MWGTVRSKGQVQATLGSSAIMHLLQAVANVAPIGEGEVMNRTWSIQHCLNNPSIRAENKWIRDAVPALPLIETHELIVQICGGFKAKLESVSNTKDILQGGMALGNGFLTLAHFCLVRHHNLSILETPQCLQWNFPSKLQPNACTGAASESKPTLQEIASPLKRCQARHKPRH